MRTKNIISTLLLLGTVVIAARTVPAQFGVTATTTRMPQCVQARLTPIKCGYFEEGYQDGAADARNNRDRDHRRYRSKFEDQYEPFYRDGYNEGYRSVRPFSEWTERQRDAYDLGYDYGEDDRDRRISRLPARYEGRYDRTLEEYYQKGYFDGYDGRAKQYGTPVGNRPTFPNADRRNGRRRGGTQTGSLTWNGRVDNRVQIVLRGDEVETRQIAGRLSGVYHNLQGVLPRRNAVVSVAKLDGRGTARVVQQPNRANGYTAIVEVFDARRSDDNYNLRISWQASNAQERYSPGRLVWRGRVDSTANIYIAGEDVEAVDQTSSGLTVLQSDLRGYLAARDGITVRVDKKEGRGSVTIIEQPSRLNDYTAVIRVFDPSGGDDLYEIEVEW